MQLNSQYICFQMCASVQPRCVIGETLLRFLGTEVGNRCHLRVCVRTCVCVCVMGCRPVGCVISCSVKGSLVAQGGALLIVVFMSPLLRALADLIS